MPRTLLVVDDIKSNREILKNMLGGDYRIIEAEHGQEALAIMTGEYQQISAVLLDLGMPVMDGYEVLSYMQTSEKLSQLPVIVTTGQTDVGSEERALKLGAKDYISKPYNSAIIRQRIRNTIKLRETAATVNALQRDRLTGLYSRDAFFEKVSKLVSAKEPGYYIMACFDIDKFKVINDQYGTQKGDEVLRHIANVFQKGFEPIGGVCCRVSADDFAVLYPAVLQDSAQLVEIRRRVGLATGLATPVAFSIGRYTITDLTMTPSGMYDRAMLAAESIKGRYDSNVAIYDESMRDHLLHEQEIVTEMEAALRARQFELWYQPQYNHSTGAIIGAEALVRWRHPQKGLVPPGVFIPVFEQNGFIYALDRYVWESACQYLKKEMDAGRAPLPVSVNISRYDVFRDDFVEFITGLISQYSIPVELLRLEITESAFTESTSHIVAVVKQLIDFGFTLEIDDFGSGYSSLNTLKNVPAQVLKLDMRFLEDREGSERGGNILESIVRMTKWLGMSVIAEGVERRSQADFLRSIGCSYVQGYLYAKPMPEQEYTALCSEAKKEEKLLVLETVANLNNDSFWNPDSMDTLIFNSYVGGACIYEYHQGNIELLRATEKYAQVIGSAGMTVEDALKLNWTEHLDAENRKKVIADLDESISTHKEVTGEYVFLDLPGCPHETHLRSTMRVIAFTGDRYLVYCTNENITAQRKAEKRERELAEQMKAVMDNVACGITAVTAVEEEITFVLANDKYYELLGYTRQQYKEEINGQAFDTLHSEDRQRVFETFNRVYVTGNPEAVEYRAQRRDGSIVWVRSILSVASFEGVAKRVLISTYTDISRRKQAELELQASTVQLQAMMDDIPGGFRRIHVLPDGSMKPVFFNEGFCRLTGMGVSEIRALYDENALAGIHPEDMDIVRTAVAQMLENGEAYSTRYRLQHGGGGYVWLSIFGRRTKDTQGNTYLNLYYMDATERVKIEQQQKELLDNLPYGAAHYEFDGEKLSVVHLNKRYWELMERTPMEYADDSFMNNVHEDDRKQISGELAAAIREGRDVAFDIRVRYGEDEYRPFHVVGRILKKSTGGYSIYASYTPISSEQMTIQQMLPIALSAMMDAQTDFSFVKDKNLKYVCCSREMAKLIGCTPAEMVGKTDRELFDGALAETFAAEDLHIMQSGESLIDSVDRLPTADGKDCYSSISKFPLKDPQGNVIGVYGIGYDVTEDRKLQSQFELLTNSIPGGLATYEFSGGKVQALYFSEGFYKLFKTSRESYARQIATDIFAGIFPQDVLMVKKQMDALIKDDAQMDCVYRVHLVDGSYKWINLKASSAERSEDRLIFNAVLFDVTERQEAEERIRISEQENRLAMQHNRSAICRFDVATGVVTLPEKVQQDHSLTETVESVPEGTIAKGIISPETEEAYRAFYREILAGNETGSAVFQRKTGKGWRWLEAHYSTIFSDEEKPVSAVISFQDITDQLEKDSAYKRWQQTFFNKPAESYSLFRCNVSQETIFDTTEGKLLKVQFAPGVFSFDEHTEQYVEQCVFEEDKERFYAFLNVDALLSGYYRGKRIITLEYREKLPEGEPLWRRLTVDLVEHAHSTDIEAYLLFEDIDRVKRLQLATIEQAETDSLTGVMNRAAFIAKVNDILRTANPGAQHALLMLDIDGFKQVNDAFGHGTGDQALIDIANALRTALRRDDLVGRLGGDEFLIFISDIPGDIIAATKASQICALTRKAFSAEVEISGSIGIAVTPRDGTDFDILYKKADAALYYVKGSGKDRYAFYHDDMTGENTVANIDTEGEADIAVKPKKKRRMLIVDDSQIDHALLTNIFSDEFIVEKAKDGNSALIRLRHYGSTISVVLLDLFMPGMDGFAILKKMQESSELRRIPVIMVSGDDNRETGLRAIREGAVDFVNKPVDAELLRMRVQSAIGKADNERLRAKNAFSEYQTSEAARYRTALECSGVVVIEHDWVAGTFIYDPMIANHIAGKFDERSLWYILLSDLVAETMTVKKMQELVQEIALDRKRVGDRMKVQLKTPKNGRHWFRMNVHKVINEFGLAGKIYITFVDLGAERPGGQRAEQEN